jgi:hypothetical protein
VSELVTEYLIYFDSKIEICNSEDSFKKLLSLNDKDNFIVESDKIKYENVVVDYSVKLNTSNKGRVFILRLVYGEENVEKHFESCLKLRKKVSNGITINFSGKVKVCTLWDDLSFVCSKQAYPLIYEVENLMRKLITKFMVINVGAQWAIDSGSEKLRQPKKGSTSTGDELDVLYNLDFIELTEVLLARYKPKISDEDLTKTHQKIFKAKASTELDLNNLKNIVQLSIWDKYFSDLTQYDAKKLKKNWHKLYLLRCKIAHNNFLDEDEYQQIINLAKELKKPLQNAIEKLEDIKILEEDKQSIGENSKDLIDEIEESHDKDPNTHSKLKLKLALNAFKMLTKTDFKLEEEKPFDIYKDFLRYITGISNDSARPISINKERNADEEVSEVAIQADSDLINEIENLEEEPLNDEN